MGIAVDCHGLITVADTDNNRVQPFQGAAPGACAALAPVQSPPDPVLPTQPKPVPPEVTLKPARTRGILAARELPLRVRCDVPCMVSISGRLLDRRTPRKGRRPSAPLRFDAQPLPAGRLTTVRATLAASDVRRLRKALAGRRGLVADLRVTASAADSAPTVVTTRYRVTG
jgi:hypothetical protein